MQQGSEVLPFSLQRLIDILNESVFEAAYDHFISKPALPYVLFSRAASDNFYADNRVFAKVNRWRLTLCTELKSTETEKTLERILDENEICYEVFDEFFVKEERLYQVIYEFEEVED